MADFRRIYFAKKSILIPLINLRKWLKADAGITLNNLTVSHWVDQSGNGDATQPIIINQPLYVPNAVNGKPSIRLDGVNDSMDFPEIMDIRTCYFVVKHRTGTQEFAPLLGHSSLYNFHGGSGTQLFNTDYTSGNILYGDGSRLCYVNGISAYGTQLLKPTNYTLISIVTYGNIGAQNFSNDRNIPGRFWDGDFAEIILYNAPHNDTDRQKVENYLMTKYGL